MLQNAAYSGSVVPMIDYKKSFIYKQLIDDQMEFWESIIIRKILKQKNSIFTCLFTFGYKITWLTFADNIT